MYRVCIYIVTEENYLNFLINRRNLKVCSLNIRDVGCLVKFPDVISKSRLDNRFLMLCLW